MAPTRVVIEADGGSRGNPGPAAFGAVLRDADTGELLAERAEAIGLATNNVAEYAGLIAGLELLREYAPDAAEVEVRMDSKLVIEQMAGRWKVKHPDIKTLATKATGLAPFGVAWTWVPRADNAHADRLLNAALDGATQLPDSPPDLGPPTRLVLLRHGQTELSAHQRFSGAGGSDPGLDSVGHEQAAAAAAWLLGQELDLATVLTSPLARTRETARIVADAVEAHVEIDDDLRETDYGAWDGLTFGEVQSRWPEALARWLGSTAIAPPGGESVDEVATRVLRDRERLVERFRGRTVLLVSHATPIKLLACAALEAPRESVYRLDVPTGSVSILDWYADGATSVRTLSRLP